MLFNKKSIEKKIKLRITYCVMLIILGAASLYVGLGVELASGNADYTSGFYTGLGCSVIVAAIITIIKNIRLLHNEKTLEERAIYESDERNVMIGLKTWSYAGYALFVLLYIGLLITAAIDVVIMNTLLVVLGVFVLCVFIARTVLCKTM